MIFDGPYWICEDCLLGFDVRDEHLQAFIDRHMETCEQHDGDEDGD